MSSLTAILQLIDLVQGESSSGIYPDWGAVTDHNLAVLEATVGEVTSKAVTVADVTLTATEELSLLIQASGILTGNRNIITSGRKGFWFVRNSCTGAFSLTFKTAAGTGIVVPQGSAMILVSDGTNILAMSTYSTISTTDNAAARFDGTAGTLQNSGLIISDTNVLTGGAWNGTVGATTPAAGVFTALTANGLFTSLGIQDVASARRLIVDDTFIKVGESTANAEYSINRQVATQLLTLCGSADRSTGMALLLAAQSNSGNPKSARFTNSNVEVCRVDGSGSGTGFLVGKTVFDGSDTVGVEQQTDGSLTACKSASAPLTLNRTTSDGSLVTFRRNGVDVGSISVAAGVVSYNSAVISHWSQLAGGTSIVGLLRGMIVETVDEMCSWPGFTYTDHEGKVQTREHGLPAGAKVGDVFDFTYSITETVTTETTSEEFVTEIVDEDYLDIDLVDGRATVVHKTHQVKRVVLDEFALHDEDGTPIIDIVQSPDEDGEDEIARRTVKIPRKQTVTRQHVDQRPVQHTVKATVIEMPDDRLARFKVSDEAGSDAVYGVFWDLDNDHKTTHDAYIAAGGAGQIRIAAGIKVRRGDLIESNGDGYGRVQADNQMRASTVAKITAAVVVETYPDGSYLVPCTLHCG